ncbi:TetR/AcrR family transcriptional regulator [Faecalicatena contorta]|uniref:TetR/AcrR family transcriptional regulator n=1 Tax=Faecalicatena contorta TaxID=39482 RepID=UPI001F31180F|nr:TetR/AcrR family transcriptional regulator [Faecalicatena contorta]MCF2682569.1 TetR/AcrR family transcriptional regulator [Faecalicatena contorta]
MGKLEEKKKKKKEALFNTAYRLFTTKGIHATAISDIVNEAGVAKGTFYLYFKDKYDIKNKLIAHKTKELFDAAWKALDASGKKSLEDRMIFIIDYILDLLKGDLPLLNFISKNLVMGALKTAFWSEEEDSDESFNDRYLEMVRQDSYEYQDVNVMLFTIVELAGSTCYNSILYGEPLPIEEYKPFLYRTVRLIIASHRVLHSDQK